MIWITTTLSLFSNAAVIWIFAGLLLFNVAFVLWISQYRIKTIRQGEQS